MQRGVELRFHCLILLRDRLHLFLQGLQLGLLMIPRRGNMRYQRRHIALFAYGLTPTSPWSHPLKVWTPTQVGVDRLFLVFSEAIRFDFDLVVAVFTWDDHIQVSLRGVDLFRSLARSHLLPIDAPIRVTHYNRVYVECPYNAHTAPTQHPLPYAIPTLPPNLSAIP